MKNTWLGAALLGALSLPAYAGLIVNGGFESGFTNWTRVNQLGGDGQFLSQSGAQSPVNLFPVPAPPQGASAAMTDAQGPGSHVLYQDFVIPSSVPEAVVFFSLFINNSAGVFFTPATLNFATPALNQQARVDIITTTADPFSLAAADILQNLYRTEVGNPPVSGYLNLQVDVTSLLQARPGQTLRLRFAEVDNVAPFNLGVDGVDVVVIPEPSSLLLTAGALAAVAFARRRWSDSALRGR